MAAAAAAAEERTQSASGEERALLLPNVFWQLLPSLLVQKDVDLRVLIGPLGVCELDGGSVPSKLLLLDIAETCISHGRSQCFGQILNVWLSSCVSPSSSKECTRGLARLLSLCMLHDRSSFVEIWRDKVAEAESKQSVAAPLLHWDTPALFGMTPRQLLALPCGSSPAWVNIAKSCGVEPLERVQDSVIPWPTPAWLIADSSNWSLLHEASRLNHHTDVLTMLQDWSMDATYQKVDLYQGQTALQVAIGAQAWETAMVLVKHAPQLAIMGRLTVTESTAVSLRMPLAWLVASASTNANEQDSKEATPAGTVQPLSPTPKWMPLFLHLLTETRRLLTLEEEKRSEEWQQLLETALWIAIKYHHSHSHDSVVHLGPHVIRQMELPRFLNIIRRIVGGHHHNNPSSSSTLFPQQYNKQDALLVKTLLSSLSLEEAPETRPLSETDIHDLIVGCLEHDHLEALLVLHEMGYCDLVHVPPIANTVLTQESANLLLLRAVHAKALRVVRHLIVELKVLELPSHMKFAWLLAAVAARTSTSVLCALILDGKCDLHQANAEGYTALHFAAFTGQTNMVDMLIGVGQLPVDLGVRKSVVDTAPQVEDTVSRPTLTAFQTPLHCAVLGKQAAMVLYLCQHHSANECASDIQGITPLHLACGQVGDKSTIESLLQCSANAEQTDNYDRTALAHALERGHIMLASKLVQQYHFCVQPYLAIMPTMRPKRCLAQLIMHSYVTQQRTATPAEMQVAVFFAQGLPYLISKAMEEAKDSHNPFAGATFLSSAADQCFYQYDKTTPSLLHQIFMMQDDAPSQVQLLKFLSPTQSASSIGHLFFETAALHVYHDEEDNRSASLLEMAMVAPVACFQWLLSLPTSAAAGSAASTEGTLRPEKRVWDALMQRGTVQHVVSWMESDKWCHDYHLLPLLQTAAALGREDIIAFVTGHFSTTVKPENYLVALHAALQAAASHNRLTIVKLLLDQPGVTPWHSCFVKCEDEETKASDNDKQYEDEEKEEQARWLPLVRAIRQGADTEVVNTLVSAMKNQTPPTKEEAWLHVARALPPSWATNPSLPLTFAETWLVTLAHVRKGLVWSGLRNWITAAASAAAKGEEKDTTPMMIELAQVALVAQNTGVVELLFSRVPLLFTVATVRKSVLHHGSMEQVHRLLCSTDALSATEQRICAYVKHLFEGTIVDIDILMSRLALRDRVWRREWTLLLALAFGGQFELLLLYFESNTSTMNWSQPVRTFSDAWPEWNICQWFVANPSHALLPLLQAVDIEQSDNPKLLQQLFQTALHLQCLSSIKQLVSSVPASFVLAPSAFHDLLTRHQCNKDHSTAAILDVCLGRWPDTIVDVVHETVRLGLADLLVDCDHIAHALRHDERVWIINRGDGKTSLLLWALKHNAKSRVLLCALLWALLRPSGLSPAFVDHITSYYNNDVQQLDAVESLLVLCPPEWRLAEALLTRDATFLSDVEHNTEADIAVEQQSSSSSLVLPTDEDDEKALDRMLGKTLTLPFLAGLQPHSVVHIAVAKRALPFLKVYDDWWKRRQQQSESEEKEDKMHWTVTHVDGNGRTALHWACLMKFASAALYLLQAAGSHAPALLRVKDKQGCVALMHACFRASPNCVRALWHIFSASPPQQEGILLPWGQHPDWKCPRSGWSPLHMAAAIDATTCLELLTDKMCVMDLGVTLPIDDEQQLNICTLPVDRYGRCPLYIAAIHNSEHVLTSSHYLHELAAKVSHTRNTDGMGILHAAVDENCCDSVLALLTLPVFHPHFSPYDWDETGRAAFHNCKSLDMLSILLSYKDTGPLAKDRNIYNLVDHNGFTVLHVIAGHTDCPRMLRLLLLALRRPDPISKKMLKTWLLARTSKQKMTALMIAVTHNCPNLVMDLAEVMQSENIGIHQRDAMNYSAFDYVLQEDHPQLFQALLPRESQSRSNFFTSVHDPVRGYLPIHSAARFGAVEILTAPGNFPVDQWRSAVTVAPADNKPEDSVGLATDMRLAHVAAFHDHTLVLEAIFKQQQQTSMAGALQSLLLHEDAAGRTPLLVAMTMLHWQPVHFLLHLLEEHGAKLMPAVQPVDCLVSSVAPHLTFLHVAVQARYQKQDMRVAKGFLTEIFHSYPFTHQMLHYQRSDTGCTPLMDALINGMMDSFYVLLKTGSNVHIHNNRGWTVLHLVVEHPHLRFIAKLIQLRTLGVPIDLLSKEGDTVLHCAVRHGWLEGVQFMIETWELKPTTTNKKGETAIDIARLGKHTAIVRYLDSCTARSP